MVRLKRQRNAEKRLKDFPYKLFIWGVGALFIMGINTPGSRLKYG